MNNFMLYLVLVSLYFTFLVFLIIFYHFGAVENIVAEYNKKRPESDVWVIIFSLVILGGVFGLLLTIALLGGLDGRKSLDDWEINVLLLGIFVAGLTTYFLTHRGIRSMLMFFYPGTTFKSRHLAILAILGDKREFQKFGMRWLTNII